METESKMEIDSIENTAEKTETTTPGGLEVPTLKDQEKAKSLNFVCLNVGGKVEKLSKNKNGTVRITISVQNYPENNYYPCNHLQCALLSYYHIQWGNQKNKKKCKGYMVRAIDNMKGVIVDCVEIRYNEPAVLRERNEKGDITSNVIPLDDKCRGFYCVLLITPKNTRGAFSCVDVLFYREEEDMLEFMESVLQGKKVPNTIILAREKDKSKDVVKTDSKDDNEDDVEKVYRVAKKIEKTWACAYLGAHCVSLTMDVSKP